MTTKQRPGRPAGKKRAANAKQRRGAAPPYHHGDLRRALLDATEALLNDAGIEGFTLREVARRAGVSHGAPAHHFGDVRGLLSTFAAESFTGMTALMKHHRERAGANPFDQLVAVGTAYIEYALAHRARFQMMFRSDRLDPNHPPLAAAGAEAYGQLLDCIGLIAREISAPDFAVQEKTALAWSLVHGYATLLIDNEKFAAQATGGHATRALGLLEAMLRLSRPAFLATGPSIDQR
jgi:AcrR family transcriptional regulator